MNANVNTGAQYKLPLLGKVITLAGGDAFERIIPFTQAYEGGESDDADDPGGWTRYGWTLATFLTLAPSLADFDGDHDVDLEDFHQLSVTRSVPLYRAVFFDKYALGKIGGRTAAVTFDASVNTGPGRGARFLQQAFNDLPLSVREFAPVLSLTADGALGPKTLTAVANVCARPGVDAELARKALKHRLAYYDSIKDAPVTKNGVVTYPFRKFHGGLTNRVMDLASFLERVFQ
ncbi:glycosyl hydrolase 108 family protein [Fundidesulfovibrio putealis]|uniref:glycosyl hydrolase 108 family protein n=1 Tax=Fundidesulfovibrio putealis TaxID=270496 RepID=UPI000485F04D|nr:glycosyl hydrolase 108 family protein [Fundidesulfovibrio putealis]